LLSDHPVISENIPPARLFNQASISGCLLVLEYVIREAQASVSRSALQLLLSSLGNASFDDLALAILWGFQGELLTGFDWD
jgi:hypothetical protein